MLKKLYEPIMAFLAILVLALLIIQLSCNINKQTEQVFNYIDNTALIIFAADYFVRLFKAENKLRFIKENIFDLIAIIPFNSIFRIARLTRLLKLTKIFKVYKFSVYSLRIAKRIDKFFKTNNFYYVLIIIFIIILTGSILISMAENMSFTDSLWWAFVTATTVGYGDISPKTGAGRIIAVILMMSGIGFIGMLTGTISTYFIKVIHKKPSYKEELVNSIKAKLDDIDSLSFSDIDEIRNVLVALKTNNSPNLQQINNINNNSFN
jgi:Ion channel.